MAFALDYFASPDSCRKILQHRIPVLILGVVGSKAMGFINGPW